MEKIVITILGLAWGIGFICGAIEFFKGLFF